MNESMAISTEQLEATSTIIRSHSLNVYYDQFQALKDITIDMKKNTVTALIGPSGCGKSTFLRTLNRMNDLVPKFRVEGQLSYNNQDIYSPTMDVVELRKQVGMVFQRPNPIPMYIYYNVAYGLRIHGIKKKLIQY